MVVAEVIVAEYFLVGRERLPPVWLRHDALEHGGGLLFVIAVANSLKSDDILTRVNTCLQKRMSPRGFKTIF